MKKALICAGLISTALLCGCSKLPAVVDKLTEQVGVIPVVYIPDDIDARYGWLNGVEIPQSGKINIEQIKLALGVTLDPTNDFGDLDYRRDEYPSLCWSAVVKQRERVTEDQLRENGIQGYVYEPCSFDAVPFVLGDTQITEAKDECWDDLIAYYGMPKEEVELSEYRTMYTWDIDQYDKDAGSFYIVVRDEPRLGGATIDWVGVQLPEYGNE